MKIGTARATSQTSAKKGVGAARGSSGGFSLSGLDNVRAAAGLTGATSIGVVDAFLALQGADGVDDALHAPRKAIERGEEMLNVLDDMKLSLLSGQMPQRQLSRLLGLVDSQRSQALDPALTEILDQIELRAMVELAKFETYPKG
ncbi:MAG: flagellar assembly protein FliX [Parvibaculum sp.]